MSKSLYGRIIQCAITIDTTGGRPSAVTKRLLMTAKFLEHEEKKLVAENRPVRAKSLLWTASQVLDQVKDGSDPERP